MNKRIVGLMAWLLMAMLVGVAGAETFGMKQKRPKLHEYGSVVMNNYSEQKNIAPVVFPHWVHRARYTCRLCHVDIGFAMTAEGTQMTETDNINGLYCGACHNGQEAFSVAKAEKNCDRCHSYGKNVLFKNNFYDFRKKMPKERFGNGIDWLKAEDEGLVTVRDYLEGVSISRAKIKEPDKFDLTPTEPNMPNIILSHQKHVVWNGCELCHPEIFPVKKSAQAYSMQDIFNGKYCGVCHDTVAFPNIDCQRCHTQPVH
ncbi:c(7)-type cytochrome triheme domain-containing protein [Desulfuromonas sp. AOP6]|uniref:c(7)-type cytochrome triheme domain-containing protein n=1 Tax=Desulfuromonas sp. AOP6 TaxID=1566351 RepID=UPI00126BBCEB|nr:c(7)-type cytochrome triheme domain-containing protein [Desulfuromonas sp. AOP6]BCA80812.1 hypothetical protein AOP6_2599 [Desulfuromonas sp. AOP6]